jgi:hypothetical protein
MFPAQAHAGLNKSEARNALARAVFFYRLSEIRNRGFAQQRYRASGLNLVTAAIVLWNTVYLGRTVHALRARDLPADDDMPVPIAARLGAHQSSGRLPVAEESEARARQVQAPSPRGRGLTWFKFRFLKSPLIGAQHGHRHPQRLRDQSEKRDESF